MMDMLLQKNKLFVLVGIAILLFVGWQLYLTAFGVPGFPAASAKEWQAVFLANNQVYFGHLRNYNSEYAVLKNIFYLRVAEPLQQGSPPQPPAINLVKLGGELHGPQDIMFIPKDKIMFWENLKPDSQVVQAISNFLGQR